MQRGCRSRGRGRRRRSAAAAALSLAAAALSLAALTLPALATAFFGVQPGTPGASNTCLARTLVSPAPQRDGAFGFATAVQTQAAVVSAPGEYDGATGRRAYLALRAAPRPPAQCLFTSYFQLAPVPSPEGDFVQLSVFGAAGAAAAGQRTFALGSLVDSAYWAEYFGSSSSSATSGATAKVSSSSSSSASAAPTTRAAPDALMAQALAKAAAPASAKASRAAAAATAAAGPDGQGPPPRLASSSRLIGRASAALSGTPISVLSALAASRSSTSSSSTSSSTSSSAGGDRLRAFMAPGARAQRLEATAGLVRAATAAASSGELRAAWSAAAQRSSAARAASDAPFARLVANASLSASSSSSSSSSSARDGDGSQRSAPPRLTLTPAASPEEAAAAAVAPAARDRARPTSSSSSSAVSPLAAAAKAAGASAAAAADLTPVVYDEVAVTYRLLTQRGSAQGPIPDIRRTQIQGPFSLPVTYDLVYDDDVAAFFNVDGAVFLGNSNPFVSVSADGAAAAFNDLRQYAAPGYDSVLYDGSVQVFQRRGTTNAYDPVDLIYNPFEDPMIFPIFIAMSGDGLTLAATGYAYDLGLDAVLVFDRASARATFQLKQTLTFDSLTEAVSSVGLSADGLALAVGTTTFEPLDGTGNLSPEEVLANVAVANTYGRASRTQQLKPRCRFDNLLPPERDWETDLAPTDNAGRVQSVKLASVLGKAPRGGGIKPTIGYRLFASVLGAPAEVYDYSAKIGASCPSSPVQRVGWPLGVPGAADVFGDLAGAAMAADGRTAAVGSQLATEASQPQEAGAAYYYGLLPLPTRV